MLDPFESKKPSERQVIEDTQTIILMLSCILVVAGLSTNIGLSIVGVALFFVAFYTRSN